MFSSRNIAVRDLSSPEGGEKTLTYERLSLKSGEHHVQIRHTMQVFAWSVKYYVFTVLIFGCASACYVNFLYYACVKPGL